jgi:NTP pyrophosphatase (non-canonical NTP hydrolase)
MNSYTLNPWRPITDVLDQAHLGKLGEELNECGSAVSRCTIQGVDEPEPVTGKLNREWLQDEIADVLANIELVTRRFNLDREAMSARAVKKMAHLRSWHALIAPGASEGSA